MFLKIVSFLFLFFLISSCNSTKDNIIKSPEELSRIVFEEIKNVKSFKELTNLVKYAPTKSDLLKLYEEHDTEYVNIESAYFRYNLDLIKWITGNIGNLYPKPSQILFTTDSVNYTVKEYCEFMLSTASDYLDYDGDLLIKQSFVNNQQHNLDLLMQTFRSYIFNAKYYSFTRGSYFDEKVLKGYWHNDIHFILDNEEKTFGIETIGKYGKGWKIIVFDD
jgi:hypothetical protein